MQNCCILQQKRKIKFNVVDAFDHIKWKHQKHLCTDKVSMGWRQKTAGVLEFFFNDNVFFMFSISVSLM